MNFKLRYQVFPVNRVCRLILDPVFPVTVNDEYEYTAVVRPFSGMRPYGLRGRSCKPIDEAADFFREERHTLKKEDGVLALDIAFPQEDCYLISLCVGTELFEKHEVYALEEDLFHTAPYKGDNHMHTYYSDGKDSPMYMAAASCRLGYDYCVITDHKLYEPSLIARDFFAGTGADFLVIPGEEVHSPDNPVHIINLGGNESVNDWWRDHEDEYRAAVDREMERMTEPMTDEDRYAAAASQVMFDRIRSVDGVSVLCHPSWIIPTGFNEHEDVTDYLFDHLRFDALELIAGGAFEVGVQLQLAYYQDRPKMPVLGSSDTHNLLGGRLEPGNFTVVFADSLSPEGIKDAIRKGFSLGANKNLLYGDYRLMKYGYFLNRNFFPEHDQLRASIGSKMLRLASSREGADSELAKGMETPRPSELFESIRYPD